MRLFHVTKKSNLESIKQHGLLCKYHLSNSKYPDQTSGPAIYLSRYEQGNNLPSSMFEDELVSIEIDMSQLEQNKIVPDDGIYWAFANEKIFTEDDLEEIMEYFKLADEDEAMDKLEELTDLTDSELVGAFAPLGLCYLKREGEIAYLGDIPASAIIRVESL